MSEREDRGRLVRETWCAWALEQPPGERNRHPSWLVEWDGLDPGQREVDMRIGEAVAAAERERITGLFGQWIAVALNSPADPSPDRWKAAFSSLIDPDFPGQIAAPESAVTGDTR